MKRTLRVSILLNCGLLGCLGFLLLNERASRQPEPPAEPASRPRASEAVLAVSPGPAVKPFHWSQVESTDYRIYIANLRGIGCPEQTIRDIVSADVDTFYAPRRKPLEEKLVIGGGMERTAAAGELRALQNQEASVLGALFGLSPATTNATPDIAQDDPPVRSVRPKAPAAISTPLVFQDVDPQSLKLSEGQQKAVNDLRQRFLDTIGGANQDPADPSYAERWRKAQPEMDQDLRGMIGVKAWQEYQMAAKARAQEQEIAPSQP